MASDLTSSPGNGNFYIEVEHLPVEEGRKRLSAENWEEYGIPSISPDLAGRWRALHKGRFLEPGDNERFLDEVLRIVAGLSDITTQRAVYYALRGAHPDWTYKGGTLGDDFYAHLVSWVMEKLQLKTGMTMQAFGVWAAPRGYIAGDGRVRTSRRGWVPLSATPALGFDLADTGVVFDINSRKVIHFEKDAGLGALTSGSFPRYIEAIFSTSQGQLSEAANKFLRIAEEHGLRLYGVHDGDPSGIQMQLMYGMASKNNAYMPEVFYPRLVKPLGFFPTIGSMLGLPPEAVTDKEDGIFGNLLALAQERERVYPELRRFHMPREVDVIVKQRRKWEFQALNAMHEKAPHIYLIESLRVHGDEIKHVPPAVDIMERVISAAVESADSEVEKEIERLAQRLYEEGIKAQLTSLLREQLADSMLAFAEEANAQLDALDVLPDTAYRERVKAMLIANPERYAVDVIHRLGSEVLNVTFKPSASIDVVRDGGGDSRLEVRLTDIHSEWKITSKPPPVRTTPLTITDIVNSIEEKVIPSSRQRKSLVSRIRAAFEERFGKPSEVW